MKKLLACGVIIPLLVGFMSLPVFAQQKTAVAPPQSAAATTSPSVSSEWYGTPEEEHQPPGDLILVDVLLLRPLGIVACGLGLAGSVVALPFTAMTDSGPQVAKGLLVKPFDYTFKRKLGDVDY